MPIDDRFAKSSFVEEYMRDPSSTKLADALEAEIQSELHTLINPKIRELVARLNSMGHALKDYTPPKPGDISFRDDEVRGDDYICYLRVGVDTVVSVGFLDTKDEDEFDDADT